MSLEDDPLDSLLLAASEDLDELNKKERVLKEIDVFQENSSENDVTPKTTDKKTLSSSLLHTGDTDSSDDEDNRYFEERKYNECGRELKKLLDTTNNKSGLGFSPSHYGQPKQRLSTWNNDMPVKTSLAVKQSSHLLDKPAFVDVFIDPIFGMRIVNPLVTSALLKDRMSGRTPVPFAGISKHILLFGKDKDWVICGVIANKSVPKTSQKGTQFSIWTLTDLKDDIKTVALFLFSGAHSDLYKTAVGTVVGVLNPNLLDRKEGSKDIATLSIDNAQKMMIFGKSKDFGTCKSTKKNGEPCTAIVNLSRCEYCIYHIKQEYQKCSKRSELQSNFVGKGLGSNLNALRNKVLGKSEVFYMGKSYTAIKSPASAKKNKKLELKDQSVLDRLSSNISAPKAFKGNTTKKKQARQLEVPVGQRLRDLELLKRLGGGSNDLETKTDFLAEHSSSVTLEESKLNALSVINKLKETKKHEKLPKNVSQSFSSELSPAVTLEESKKNALSVINKLKEKKKSGSSCENGDLKSTAVFPENVLESFSNKHSPVVTLDESKKNSLTVVNKLKEEKKSGSGHDNGDLKNASGIGKSKEICNNRSKPLSKCNLENDHSPVKCIVKKTASNMIDSNNLVSEKSSLSQSTLSPSVLKKSFLDSSLPVPTLSGSGTNGFIDLTQSITPKRIDRTKLSAIEYIQKHGPIVKADPNSTKGSGKKRILISPEILPESKKSKLQESDLISDRFKKMMAATSKHVDLLEVRDNEEKEKYFNKLEAKERMEDKMINTFKAPCKAVKCLKCKYTSFSASDLCKSEQHPLKVFDAFKRFFKCGNCQNRTVSLNLVPTKPCNNCGASKWEKTGMMKEKLVQVTPVLSVRGGEQKYINSVATDVNIDLLVPEDGT